MSEANGSAVEADSDLGVFLHYWKIYGGWKAAFSSPYFWGALALCALLFPLWVRDAWWDTVLSILPNLLGFSLAGYAIFLAFGNDKFREFLSKTMVGSDSAFLSITTTFMHFVVVQILAIGLALFAKSAYQLSVPAEWPYLVFVHARYPLWLVGFLLFCYTLTTSFAALIAIFRLVRLLDKFNRVKQPTPGGAGGKGNGGQPADR